MKSELTEDFIGHFRQLPDRIKKLARKNYRLWEAEPNHPSLEFKRVGKRNPVFSVRVGIGWRALGVLDDDTMIWFWIGSHAEYDSILRRLR